VEEDRVNRRFLERQIQRVEFLLQIFTYRRMTEEGQMSPDVAQEREVAVRSSLERVEQELLHQIQERNSGKLRFPLLDLYERYELQPSEQEIFIFSMVPHLDDSVRKSYARYNDNVLLDFPSVQFLTRLVGESREGALSARSLFDESGTLRTCKLLDLRVPRDIGGDHLLGMEVRPPDRLVDFVLGRSQLDRTLLAYCELEQPQTTMDEVVLPEKMISEVTAIVDRFPEFRARIAKAREENHTELGGALVLQFCGVAGTGKTLFTKALVARMEKPLLRVSASKLMVDGVNFENVLDNIFFEAALHDAVLCFDSAEAMLGKASKRLPVIYERFESHDGLVIVAAGDRNELDPSLERWVGFQVKFEMPGPELRQRIWEMHLPQDIKLSESVDMDILANQYDLTGFQIRNAVVVATNRALALDPAKPEITTKLLQEAAYAQLRADMEEYSTKSKIYLSLDDLILPDKQVKQVEEILNAVKVRVFVMNRWGFAKRLVTGKGIVCLFGGEPGTGKTLCAEILANELELNLYQVSIPRIMSKYIGETEKNIEKIFSTARANQSMLLFDEADSLFTSRVKVESSVDRFSNMEVNLLLQEIERFEGIVILTTNLDKNIDKAFQRRINFRIDFPFPKPEYRSAIWEKLVPEGCPVADDIDFDVLGEYFELSGGHIKNAVIRAAYRAYGLERPINYDDFIFAAEQECMASGRIFRTPERD